LNIQFDKNNLVPHTAVIIAAEHIENILSDAIKYSPQQRAVIIFDTLSPLSVALTQAYQHCLPEAAFIDFHSVSESFIHDTFNKLKPADLVVLIQSTSFRLNAFRIRVELFNRSLKVIEHPHLQRMYGDQARYYIDSLNYDSDYFHRIGHGLKAKIDCVNKGIVNSGNGCELIFDSPFESAKLNIGDYTHMNNIGGQFPIGEVFTEAKNLEAVNGQVRIFAFGDTDFQVRKVASPINLIVKNGRVIDTINSTDEFNKVLANIKADEGEVWLRELGFGLNKAFTPERIVVDIGTYERMCGIHLSLGAKHGLYKKPNFKRTEMWHHVDVFAVTETVLLDNDLVFKNSAWCVS
jgi:aminopeptidase